ncbi:phage tail sheath C-terminal domain-containing protein [Tropicimonas sp. IMCC34043]|uniref:phage tail sheath C-terminal domain-containing protein n=1 Tax=Tropicimonas sp. IMCC34043 TaxID=2248760 RepID=UPI000E282A5F|nr:phage tail sheath C-terminal domain-containing protein [Tropicimonas sp. IMCC34043]
MPVNPTYPGVYIEEIPSGVRSIRGVATSVAAFIGPFRRGLLDEAVRIQSPSDFEREYGGVYRDSEASYAVQQFFLNGGTEAWVIRVGHPGPAAAGIVPIAAATAGLNAVVDGVPPDLVSATAGRVIRDETADNPGDWGNALRLEVGHATSAADTLFTLTIKEVVTEGDRTSVLREEVFRNLTNQPNEANTAIDVVNGGSQLVYLTQVAAALSDTDIPHATGTLGRDIVPGGGDFAGAVATVAEMAGLTVTLQFGPAASPADIGPVAVDFTGAADPATMGAWAALFQERLRRAALDPLAAIPVGQRAYLGGAVVTLLGAGSVAEPFRFHIRAGQGAQPFDPDVRLIFAGNAGTFGLDGATSAGPQQIALTGGADGTVVDAATGTFRIPEAAFSGNPGLRTGLFALEDVDLFNILCIPDAPRLGDANALALYSTALSYVTDRRSMLIVDIPEGTVRIDQMETWLGANAGLRAPNTAVYFPRTYVADSLRQNRLRSFASSGTIAGLWARTDAQRGVWKAPAGTDARLRAVQQLAYAMTDPENGVLNPLGVNCLRSFPIYGSVCWGARTMDGADQIASDYKYVPVRRTTLFIEESLYRGTKWVVFEPNDEPLWAQIRLNVGAFMHDLFRQGAFQGAMPSDAYLVKCDAETTTQSDIDNGIVNILVGFSPLKPAEFVILRIQQIARRAES